MDFNTEELVITGTNCSEQNIVIKYYPDGMPIITDALSKNHMYKALLRPKNLNNFMAAMFWFDAMKARDIKINHLILPFVPGARQDRLNKTGDQLFTIKSIAQVINTRKFKSVTILDPHSDVTSALINNCNIITSDQCIASNSNALIGIISPDGGAEKRALKVAQKFNLPLFHAWKSRDVGTGKITGFGMEPISENIKSGRLLIIDDICDAGGTFLGLTDVIPKQFSLDLYVTHGLFTKGYVELLKKFKNIYTTDSVIQSGTGAININPICMNLLSKGI